MCGVAGYFSDQKFDHQSVLYKMGIAIEHRGPDEMGIWFDDSNGIGLCHRRLSILDLSQAGSQPMHSFTGRYIIAFNGEIYNFKDIKREIESHKGDIKWRGHSDTEIILTSMEIWGFENTLKKLIGMFVIVLWDTKNKELLLARDRIGEKPLYYGWQNNTFLFGSELKALQIHPAFKKEISLEALGKFFKYNYVPSGDSIFKGIVKLVPGTYCKVTLHDKQINCYTYWRLEDHVNQSINKISNINDATNQLEMLLTDAIGKQMIADVPLGAFLSGGVDSSTIVALMQAQSNRPVKTFSMGFNEKGFDEAQYAKKVAQHLGTEHTEMYVSPDEARNVIPLLADIYDEPFSDSSQIPTYLVAKLAKSKVTVSLSGDAGDELFSGYNRYLMVNNVWGKLSKVPKSVRKLIGNILLNKKINSLNAFYDKVEFAVPRKFRMSNFGDKMHKVARLLDVTTQSGLYDGFTSHWNTREIMSEDCNIGIHDIEHLTNSSFIERMMFADTKAYLPDDILVKVDRAAMANSLETRVPFLDHRVVEFAWNLPMDFKLRDNTGKWILRQVLYRHVPKTLIERPKMGFGIPLDTWLRGPLKEWATDTLSESNLNKHKFLNNRNIQIKLKEHLSGQKNWQYQLWDVLMFQNWYEKYCG